MVLRANALLYDSVISFRLRNMVLWIADVEIHIVIVSIRFQGTKLVVAINALDGKTALLVHSKDLFECFVNIINIISW